MKFRILFSIGALVVLCNVFFIEFAFSKANQMRQAQSGALSNTGGDSSQDQGPFEKDDLKITLHKIKEKPKKVSTN